MKYTFLEWIKNNPTWAAFILDLPLDYKLLDHQIHIRACAIQLAFNEWIDYKYK